MVYRPYPCAEETLRLAIEQEEVIGGTPGSSARREKEEVNIRDEQQGERGRR
jgi:hypothetical protein